MTSEASHPRQTAGSLRAEGDLAARLRRRASGRFVIAPAMARQQGKDRWSAFARSFLERYRVVDRALRGISMLLPQRPVTLQWLCQRWEAVAYQLAPRIQLAINSIHLASVLGGEGGPRGPIQNVWERPVMVALSRVMSDLLVRGRSEGVSTLGRTGAQQQWPRVAKAATFPRLNVPQYRTAVSTKSSALAAPSATLLAGGSELVDRLRGARRRREEMWGVTRAFPEASARSGVSPSVQVTAGVRPIYAMPPRAVRVAETPGELRRSAGHALRDVTAASPIPAVNIERLTDEVVRQLDRRLVAHQERIGKVF